MGALISPWTEIFTTWSRLVLSMGVSSYNSISLWWQGPVAALVRDALQAILRMAQLGCDYPNGKSAQMAQLCCDYGTILPLQKQGEAILPLQKCWICHAFPP
ncbi:hypothetical protein K370107A2_00700 [Merdimmobilis hominis]